jgi:hypothetical protein
LTKTIKIRYNDYIKGDVQMPPCCGNTNAGTTLLAAKGYFDKKGNTEMNEKRIEQIIEPTITWVRMEFLGEQAGSIQFAGKNNRFYKGSASAHKYADVHPNDVAFMQGTGKWRIVPKPVEQNKPQVNEVVQEEIVPEILPNVEYVIPSPAVRDANIKIINAKVISDSMVQRQLAEADRAKTEAEKAKAKKKPGRKPKNA